MKVENFKKIVESILEKYYPQVEAKKWENGDHDLRHGTISISYHLNNERHIVSFPEEWLEDFDIDSKELRNEIMKKFDKKNK